MVGLILARFVLFGGVAALLYHWFGPKKAEAVALVSGPAVAPAGPEPAPAVAHPHHHKKAR